MACRTRKRGRRYSERRVEKPAGHKVTAGAVAFHHGLNNRENSDDAALWQVRPHNEVKKLSNFTNEQAAAFAQRNAAKLSPREADFVRDVLRHRWRGPPLSLSEKQGAWVQRIAARIRDEVNDEDIGDLVLVERVEGWA